MSLAAEYLDGFHAGVLAGEFDQREGLGVYHDVIADTRERIRAERDAEQAGRGMSRYDSERGERLARLARKERARLLGFLRAYREETL